MSLLQFIETDPECYLPNLSEYIKFEKGKDGGKNRIALECIDMLVKMRERIQSVEVYYNTHTTELDMKIDGAKYFDIVTQEEVQQ